MKTKFLLLFLSLFMVVGGVKAQNWQAEEVPSNGGKYYLYNTNTGQYLNASGLWVNKVSKGDESWTVSSGFGDSDTDKFVLYSTKKQFNVKNQWVWVRNVVQPNLENATGKTGNNYYMKATKAGGSNTYAFRREQGSGYKNWKTNEDGTFVGQENASFEWQFISQNQVDAYYDTDKDASNKILNANGNYDPKYHWTITGQVGLLNGNSNTGKDGKVGIFEVSNWGATSFDCKMEQTINDLPKGFYQLSVDCQASDKSVLKVYAGDKEVTTVSKNEGWETYTTDVVEVTNGTLTIGARGTANAEHQWTNVDNFKLTYLGNYKAELSCKADKHGTFVAPFEVDLPDGVTSFIATGVNNNEIVLVENGTTVSANTPVILQNTDKTNPASGTYYGNSSSTDDVSANANLLVGLLSSHEVKSGYVLQTPNDGTDQRFFKVNPEKPVTLAANRCYLNYSAPAVKEFSLGGDDATAIDAVEALISGSAQIFDINGRKLDRLQKGINIVNGKKIMVK